MAAGCIIRASCPAPITPTTGAEGPRREGAGFTDAKPNRRRFSGRFHPYML